MKPGFILVYARDEAFAELVSQALRDTGEVILVAQSVAEALQIVSERGKELKLAVMDFEEGCRGMTLLSAIHTCYQQLPIVVATLNDAYHAKAIAYANGANACLKKPISAMELAKTIQELEPANSSLAAA